MNGFVSIVAVGLALLAGAPGAPQPVKKRRPLPPEFGRVVINNRSEKAGLAPVAFDHWLHRAKYTCRVCHVDVGFAMKAGATDIRAADNMKGFYCGACHNGRTVSDGKKVFEACGRVITADNRGGCDRCHSVGKTVTRDYDFATFTKALPRGRFGNGVDWEKAEEDRLVTPSDELPGVSIKRTTMAVQKDFALAPKVEAMPDIVFSHRKHTVWNGCELCHPELFLGVKKGSTKYSMVDIFEGKYCGACHATVAFPLIDCQRCHSAPVE